MREKKGQEDKPEGYELGLQPGVLWGSSLPSFYSAARCRCCFGSLHVPQAYPRQQQAAAFFLPSAQKGRINPPPPFKRLEHYGTLSPKAAHPE